MDHGRNASSAGLNREMNHQLDTRVDTVLAATGPWMVVKSPLTFQTACLSACYYKVVLVPKLQSDILFIWRKSFLAFACTMQEPTVETVQIVETPIYETQNLAYP